MFRKSKLKVLALVTSLGLSAANAEAAQYNYVVEGQTYLGGTQHVDLTLDTVAQTLTVDITVAGLLGRNTVTRDAAGNLVPNGNLPGYATGFTLVMNDGPMPRDADLGTLAMLYVDASDGSGSAQVGAYTYNNPNNFDSYATDGAYIGAGGTDLTATYNADGSSVNFKGVIDLSVINAFGLANGIDNWQGLDFNESVGIWFHPVTLRPGDAVWDSATGDVLYGFNPQDWSGIDLENQRATAVPEPTTMALLAAGGLGAFRRRRK